MRILRIWQQNGFYAHKPEKSKLHIGASFQITGTVSNTTLLESSAICRNAHIVWHDELIIAYVSFVQSDQSGSRLETSLLHL